MVVVLCRWLSISNGGGYMASLVAAVAVWHQRGGRRHPLPRCGLPNDTARLATDTRAERGLSTGKAPRESIEVCEGRKMEHVRGEMGR